MLVAPDRRVHEDGVGPRPCAASCQRWNEANERHDYRQRKSHQNDNEPASLVSLAQVANKLPSGAAGSSRVLDVSDLVDLKRQQTVILLLPVPLSYDAGHVERRARLDDGEGRVGR